MCETCHPGATMIAQHALRGMNMKVLTQIAETQSVANPDTSYKVFSGGPIITMQDGKLSPVSALGIGPDKEGKSIVVIAIGDTEEVNQKMKSRVGEEKIEQCSLNGQCLFPGIVEPHLHLILTALATGWYEDFGPLNNPTVNDALQKLEKTVAGIKEKQASEPKPYWVAGYGYDPSRTLGDKGDHVDLTRDVLDKYSGSVPVFILNQSGHIGYCNSAAIDLANLAHDPRKEFFEFDSNGELTGVVFEKGTSIVGGCIYPQPSESDLVDYMMKTLTAWAAKGCTTVFDGGLGSVIGETDLALIKGLSPYFPFRFIAAMSADMKSSGGSNNHPYAGKSGPMDLGEAKLQAVKFWADGSTQGFTAALTKEYKDDPEKNKRGVLNYPKHYFEGDTELHSLQDHMKMWHELGWQIVVHANGDRATQDTLNAYKNILSAGGGENKHMHRVEHFTVTSPEQVSQAKELALGVSHTIGHVHYWGETFKKYVLGAERADRIHALKDDVDRDICWSLHSDAPVTAVDPFLYVRTAVTRRMYDPKKVDNPEDCEVLGPEQCVSLEDALRAITYNPAKQLGLLHEVGSLTPGKSADFVILNHEPKDGKEYNLDSLEVLQTWWKGACTYKK